MRCRGCLTRNSVPTFENSYLDVKKAIIKNGAFDVPVDDPALKERLLKLKLCEHFGWTWDYVDSIQDFRVMQMLHGWIDGNSQVKKMNQ